MYAPEPDDVVYGSSPKIPPHAAQLIGVSLESGLRIVGSDGGGGSLGGYDPLGVVSRFLGGSSQDVGGDPRQILQRLQTQLGANLPSGFGDLVDQLQQVANLPNIPIMSGPGAGTGNKQGLIDKIVTGEILREGREMGPQSDPSRGKIPNWTSHSDPTIHSDAFTEMLNALQMAELVHQTLQNEMQSHDPYRNDPLHYAPINPGIYSDDPEGTQTTKNPDGSTTKRFSDGTVTTIYPDGHQVTTLPTDVKPENWSANYAVLYGGIHGEEEQVFGS